MFGITVKKEETEIQSGAEGNLHTIDLYYDNGENVTLEDVSAAVVDTVKKWIMDPEAALFLEIHKEGSENVTIVRKAGIYDVEIDE